MVGRDPLAALTEENPAPVDDEQVLLKRLRAGDADAFSRLVARYHRVLMHVSRAFIGDSIAEDIVQETWMAVIDGLDKFEGRSTLRTWICSIAVNRARLRRLKEGRTVPFSSMGTVSAEEFGDADGAPGPCPPSSASWDERTPEALLANAETGRMLAVAIEGLSPAMRAVLAMRDMEGMSSVEVCQILDITEVNQRVLLHRARMRLRAALAATMKGD